MARVDGDGAWERLLGLREKRRVMEKHAEEKKDLEKKNGELQTELKIAKRRVGAAEGELSQRLAAAEELRLQRALETPKSQAKVYTQKQMVVEVENELSDAKDSLKEANMKYAAMKLQADSAVRKLLCSERSHAAQLRMANDAVTAEAASHTADIEDLSSQLKDKLAAVASLISMNESLEKMAEGERIERNLDTVKMKKAHVAEFEAMTSTFGIDSAYRSAPKRKFEGDCDKPHAMKSHGTRVKKHVAAVLAGRCDDDESLDLVAKALIKAGGDDIARRLMDTKEFAPAQKEIVADALATVEEHWTARLSVHIWDHLELSERKMEMLRHLLSFVYDKTSNNYVPIKIWVNPNDERDFLLATQLVSKHSRQKDFEYLAGQCHIVVGADGHCQRDAVTLVDQLYSYCTPTVRLRCAPTSPRTARRCLFSTSTRRGLRSVEAARMLKLGVPTMATAPNNRGRPSCPSPSTKGATSRRRCARTSTA